MNPFYIEKKKKERFVHLNIGLHSTIFSTEKEKPVCDWIPLSIDEDIW